MNETESQTTQTAANDAVQTQDVQNQANATKNQDAATDSSATDTAMPTGNVGNSEDTPVVENNAGAAVAAASSTTQQDIVKIKQAIAGLESLGESLMRDEIAALQAKLASLEEKARQEAQTILQEAEDEVHSLADQFYAKTGIRPWGLLVVAALYLVVKLGGILFPWLK